MQRDRQIVVVVAPQLVEQHLGLRARVDEDQRHAVRLDRLRRSRAAHSAPSARPRAARRSSRGWRCRRGAPSPRHHDLGEPRRGLALMRHEIGGKLGRPRHGRRQADGGEPGRQRAEPRQIERQQIAALARGERVQLVEDHIFEGAEQLGGALMRQHQRDLLRRGQQDVGRQHALAGAARGRRVAGARLEPDRQRHLRDRRGEVARDVDGQRLERRDIERVDRGRRASRFGGRRARSTRLGRKPASVLPPPVGAISSVSRPGAARARAARAGARAGASRAL